MVSGGRDVFGAPAGGRFRPQDRSAGHEGRCLMTLPRVELGHCWGGRVPQLAGAFDAARPFGESFFGKMKRRDHIDIGYACAMFAVSALALDRISSPAPFCGIEVEPHPVRIFSAGKLGGKMSQLQRTVVIGLGSMGYGMAQSCLRAGHETYGFDVAIEPMVRLQAEGGGDAPLSEVSGKADAVVVVVLNAAQTEDVLFGPQGVVPLMRQGAVVVACATVPPEFAREMAARCEALGVHYLDAPISGGALKSAAGQLSIMAAGKAAAFSAAGAVLKATAETVFEVGDVAGAGSAMKAVNQLLAGVHIATMAEAMTFGMTQGVSPDMFVEVISKCAGSSWMLENRAPHIVAGDYTPHSQVNIWPKDLGIVLDIAKAANFSAPLTETALQQFDAAAVMGLGREDDAAVAKVYARNAGLTLPGEDV